MTNRPQIVRLTELVDGVRVDYIVTEPDDDLLEQAISDAKGTPPVLPVAALILAKLRTGRRRDHGDVVELVKRGAVDVDEVRRFLARADEPALLPAFEELIRAVDTESA